MIWSIAQKEFYNNLISARFLIGFFLCLLLVPFIMLVSIREYRTEQQTYATACEEAAQVAQSRVWSAYRPIVVRPPETLSVFSQGITSNVGNSVRVQVGEIPIFAEGQTTERDNPLLNAFSTIDFITIMVIMLSLSALMFTYDACSDERETGTLKLTLSNSISRAAVLMGKFFGIVLTLMPMFVFCYLLAILFVLLSPDIQLSAQEWVRTGLLFIIGIVYCTFFILAGLVISTLSGNSSTSGVFCFSLWILLVFMIPNVAALAARTFVPVESYERVREQMKVLNSGIPASPNVVTFKGANSGSDGYREVTGITPELAGQLREYYRDTEPFRLDIANQKWAYQKAYLDRLNKQQRIADMLSMLSPAELFQIIASGICRTDAEAYLRFMDSVRGFREMLMVWFMDNGIFGRYDYYTRQDPDTFMHEDAMVEYMTMGEYRTFLDWITFAQQGGSISSTIKRELDVNFFMDFEPLDFSAAPQYSRVRTTVSDDVQRVFYLIAILLFAGVILFYVSFVSFVRYDVR